MSICKIHACYATSLNKLSCCSSAKANLYVTDLVDSGLKIAEEYHCKDQVLLHELFLRRVFYDLLNKICDPLVNKVVRRICLDHMYKPLFALKKFYREHHEEQTTYYQLERELRVLSFEFLECRR